jgi:adenosylcobinamide-GDP ribazoletransferase
MKRWLQDVLVAFQFLTRLPLSSVAFNPDALSRSTKFFPVVGLVVGLGASLLFRVLTPHLSRAITAVLILVYLVVVTGGLHEDGLADAADGFGGGWKREQILTIMRDSRIGSFGAIALVLSLLARCLLLSALPANRFIAFVVSAQVLCRWTTLPLSHFLRPARENDGQGARIADKVSRASLAVGTLLTLVIIVYALRTAFWMPLLVSSTVTCLSGLYYSRRIGGVTGDCFGTTNQLTEIAVYLCGVWSV